MRFFEGAPNIPSYLIEQQAQGNVIFFCGAGVSVPAGLDTFRELTNHIVHTLSAEDASDALAASASFDRVFSLLVREFGREEIDRQIYQRLGYQVPATLTHHSDILDLSRGGAGTPQVVTTNFDRLFEQARTSIRPIVPPGLPDIELNRTIGGVVYLHGRLAEPGTNEVPSYVISSSDFGRAYLAEGWATRFVKSLRENYTIVLLGYSADDPPVRYLLEGLNVRDGVTYNSPIYVFTDKTPDEAEELWLDRGVTPICYCGDETHSSLWSSIAAWAEAARSPQSWTKSMVTLAQQAPSLLKPFERGQVVQLVSTKGGARSFADADPAASSEWLCVFDPHVRFAKPQKVSWEEGAETFDPQDIFGLDDDPLRPTEDDNRAHLDGVHNPLAWQPGDAVQHEHIRLQGWNPLWSNPLPSRLHHLARWFGAVCHEPPAIWWAAGWKSLNPHMTWFVANRIRSRHGEQLPEIARYLWSVFLEALETLPIDDRADRWFEFEGLVRQAGWTPVALRYFERCVTPYVETSRPNPAIPRPPHGNWDTVSARDVVNLDVTVVDRHGHNLQIPADVLPQILPILRRALVRMSDLLNETGNLFWRAPTLYPTPGGGAQYHSRKEQFFLWYKDLFDTLSEQDLGAARREFSNWPFVGNRIFPKLGMWAAARGRIADASQAFALVKSLELATIWDAYNHREFLFLLKARWADFSRRQRRSIERIIERGPPRWEDETRSDHRLRKGSKSATLLRWLELNGCELSEASRQALNALKRVDPRWSDEWAKEADESFESRGGWVQEITDVGDLPELPVSKIVEAAKTRTIDPFRELRHYRPFKGLVHDFPFRALSALRISLKTGNFPAEFWRDLLSNWPEGTSKRLQGLLAHTIANISNEDALEIRYYSTDWLQKHLLGLYQLRRSEALRIFDGFLRPFQTSAPELTESSLGTTSVRGVRQERSEVSVNKTINSPIGHLTEALWSLTRKKAKKGCRLQSSLELRFAQLTTAQGQGAGHAIATLTKRLGWIAYCYPEWMFRFLLPKFEIDHPLAEAAWHGLAYDTNPLTLEVWNVLKRPFLSLLKGEARWRLDPHERDLFIQALVWLSREGDSVPVFSFDEVRNVLASIDDQGRGRALWTLSSTLKEPSDWVEFVKPFIENAWPRQLRFRSEETTRGFVQIVENSDQDFADVVQTVLPFVRPVPHANLFTYHISREHEDSENVARRNPAEALLLLNAITPDDRTQMPYELRAALEALAELNPSLTETVEFRRLRGLVD